MPLFGRKKADTGESWTLGKSALKQGQEDRHNDFGWDAPRKEHPPVVAELPTSETQSLNNVQNNSRRTLPFTESSKTFAVELDGSTISSLPPSHRDGGSISGSEPFREPSTKATSVATSSPSDLLTQEFLVPDSGEKEVLISKNSMIRPEPNNLVNLSMTESNKEVYIPSRPESSIFSLPMTPGSMSKPFREYRFYNTPNFKDLVVCDPTQTGMFFAEISSHTRSKADVSLRDIRELPNIPASKSMSINEKDIAKTPIVATADYVPDENASQIRIGIGDPLDPAGCVWIAMKNVARDAVSGAEQFDMSIPRREGGTLVFSWIRNATSESEPSNEATDAKEAYRLVCYDQVIASFRNTSMTNVRKRGSLRIYEGPLVEEYLLLIFLSASAMSEMYRRRRCKKIRRSFLVPF